MKHIWLCVAVACLGSLFGMDRAIGAEASGLESVFWQSVKDSGDRRDYEDYLNRFPDGVFVGIAQRRLESLSANGTLPRGSGNNGNTWQQGAEGQWSWDLIFDSSTQCRGVDQIKPLRVSGGKIHSSFTHHSDGGMFNVQGKVDDNGNVSMYAVGTYAVVDMTGSLRGTAGGGRIDVHGDGVICLGEWKAWR